MLLLKIPEVKVTIANNGELALDLIREKEEDFDLILMDVQMPVMDGFTCTLKIRNRNDELKNIPIIAVTANVMDTDKKRCIESGMDEFLKKPVELELLSNTLSLFVEQPK